MSLLLTYYSYANKKYCNIFCCKQSALDQRSLSFSAIVNPTIFNHSINQSINLINQFICSIMNGEVACGTF